VAFCLVAVGGGAITTATRVVARDYLTRQADQQLRSYAGLLTSRPFALFPGLRLAPGTSGLGATGRVLSIAVLSTGGQMLMSAGPATPPAASTTWLEISEPVSYQVEHIPFVYGADDSSLSVASKTGPGFAGTLVIGLDLAGVGRTVGSLTVVCLEVTGLAVLLAGAAAAGLTRMLLRPVARAAETEAAAARDGAQWAAGTVAVACGKMRRPLSVLAGLAEYHRERGEPGGDAAERVMLQVALETARMAALVDELRAAASDGPRPGAQAAEETEEAQKRWTAGEGPDRLTR
jgi:hypothetical protein